MADKFARVFGSFLRRIIDMGDGTWSERVVAVPPADMVEDGRLRVDAEMAFPPAMVTDDRLKVNLDEPIDVTLPANLVSGTTSLRLRVDPGQTGFFEGRMFRNYLEALIPTAGPSVQFRFTSPVDFILWQQELDLTQGALELRVYTGAAPSGTWVDKTPIGVNRMAARPLPYYAAQCRFGTGGNFTGGTEVDLLKLRASAANNTANNVGAQSSERGLPAGSYYGRLSTLTGGVTVNDAAQTLYSLLWEERP